MLGSIRVPPQKEKETTRRQASNPGHSLRGILGTSEVRRVPSIKRDGLGPGTEIKRGDLN